MSWIAVVVIMALVALTGSSSDTTPLKSLCVLDADLACWVDKQAGERRELEPGDYVLSPEDMNRILDRLKSVQK